MSEKLHKLLADCGVGSRREMERWIEKGRVRVNGEVASLGLRAERTDRIEVDGKRVRMDSPANSRVLVLNKREGVICTRNDPEGRTTVFQGLPKLAKGRWVTVGRLDVNTAGLLILTNDGTLAHRLMHPSTGIDREYAVRVEGILDDEQLARLTAGVAIDGEQQKFSDIRYYDGRGHNHWYHVVLMEGKNREVRRLFESQGVRVTRLKRVRYGPVALPSWLRRGQVAELGRADLAALYRLLRLPCVLPPQKNRQRGDKRSLLIPYPELESLRGARRAG